MNSRRLIGSPDTSAIVRFKVVPGKGASTLRHVRFGSQADMCSASSHVRFTPDSDPESGLSRKAVSALPPKADVCGAVADICYGPIADSCTAAMQKLAADENPPDIAVAANFWRYVLLLETIVHAETGYVEIGAIKVRVER